MRQKRIGIRREDKNIWERRTPLTPEQIKRLTGEQGIVFVVQSSPIRAFPDSEFLEAGAKVRDDISDCPVVLGIKEMPAEFFQPDKTYVFFAHVIKGQAHNMAMLKRVMELGCSLIDYERIADEQGRRLLFFGRFAGIAGMIDTLAGFGQRLKVSGWETPFQDVKLAHEYGRVDTAREALVRIGERVRAFRLPDELSPLIIGVTGYGNVAKGAGEMLRALNTVEIKPAELPRIVKEGEKNQIYHVVFKEEYMVEPVDSGHRFDLQEYFAHPELYQSRFERYLPFLSVLVNCIYWDSRYPRLVTKSYLKEEFAREGLRLLIIGDISCDIEGSIEATVKATNPGAPFFVYDPLTGQAVDGVEGSGVVIMAVDNLPCELAIDASQEFGTALMPFIPDLVRADFTCKLEDLQLPLPLRRALILHQGRLTPEYEYMAKFLKREGLI